MGFSCSFSGVRRAPWNRTRREPCDNGPPGGHAVPMRTIGRGLKTFYVKAYTDNLTGLAGMVAYSLLLSVFPVALIALFVAGQVLASPRLEHSVLLDLQGLHPELGVVTLRQLLSTWVAHDLDHVVQIARVMARRYTDAVGPWTAYLRVLRP